MRAVYGGYTQITSYIYVRYTNRGIEVAWWVKALVTKLTV